ncbi:hypothetical protein RM590_18335 [Streptomyces sp. DSM 44938]|uniref:Secreted protein n=2 Tax=Streptomyces litchfieldiae TaxID=3075543 RepID=A0ABU2MSF4_9ACTN|nr:hypothetical protein [Streptomyces sp. DSM 44938]
MTIRRVAVPAGLVLALALAAGTAIANEGGSDNAAETETGTETAAVELVNEGWPAPMAASGPAEGLVLPLEDYLIPYQDQVAWETARRTVEQECVTERGLRWFAPVTYVDPSIPYNTMNTPRRYGITVLADAEQYGYELPPLDTAAATSRSAEATDTEIAVLTGRTDDGQEVAEVDGIEVPEGGCYGESARTVGELDEELANELAGQAMEASETHPDVVAAIADWSACMAGHGFTVAHPYEASEITTAPATEVAVTDIGCKEEVGLVDTWFAVESAIQEDLINEHRAALDGEREQNAEVLATAEALR